jgi:phosphatidylserine/phosphatidylglycerophosphate/cardiolipin synthase-like enzyme
VHLAFYNPLDWSRLIHFLRRDHRKILVVDAAVAFVGGAGLTDDFDPQVKAPLNWRETMVEVRGPVAQDWTQALLNNWHKVVAESLVPRSFTALAAQPHTDSPGQCGRVVLSSFDGRRDVRRALTVRFRSAQRRLWLATAYFVPSWKIRRLLRRAASRGVDVRVLVPGPTVDHPAVRHAGRRFFGRLLHSGVRIYEYQPRFFHAKTVLCDDWASIGSSNVDRWNLRWNLEANQEVDDTQFAEAVAAMFARDLAASEEIDYQQWRTRSWLSRLQESFWGWIDRVVDRRLQRHD